MQDANAYMAYVSRTGEAFLNPAPALYGKPNPAIGSDINGCIVVAVGTEAQAQAVVSAINATLPAEPSFAEMLEAI